VSDAGASGRGADRLDRAYRPESSRGGVARPEREASGCLAALPSGLKSALFVIRKFFAKFDAKADATPGHLSSPKGSVKLSGLFQRS
jgi:hypothetical protein